jgi:hypothetical protein
MSKMTTIWDLKKKRTKLDLNVKTTSVMRTN